MMSQVAAFLLVTSLIFLQLNLFAPRELVTNSLTIVNGINTLRGQSIQAGLPAPLPQLLFNKVQILMVAALHWLRHLSPGVLLEPLPKVLLVPLVAGVIVLIKRWPKDRWLLVLPGLITLPSTLIYPAISYQLILLTAPFLLLIAVYGWRSFSRPIQQIMLIVLVIELLMRI